MKPPDLLLREGVLDQFEHFANLAEKNFLKYLGHSLVLPQPIQLTISVARHT
jgi:hypothetical protein